MDPRDEILEMVPPLNAFARRFYRDAYDVEDLVQETLARALTSIDSYAPGTRMKSWVFTIMRHAYYNRIRVYDREKPGAAECASVQPTHAAAQEEVLELSYTIEAIRLLPLDLKEVMVLVVFMGVSYRDAAEICGCRMGTVQSRLFRARERLREAPSRAA